MFLKYSLIGLGSAGVVGVGGYAVYHEVSKNKLNKDVQSQYGKGSTTTSDGRVLPPLAVDPSVQGQQQNQQEQSQGNNGAPENQK